MHMEELPVQRCEAMSHKINIGDSVAPGFTPLYRYYGQGISPWV